MPESRVVFITNLTRLDRGDVAHVPTIPARQILGMALNPFDLATDLRTGDDFSPTGTYDTIETSMPSELAARMAAFFSVYVCARSSKDIQNPPYRSLPMVRYLYGVSEHPSETSGNVDQRCPTTFGVPNLAALTPDSPYILTDKGGSPIGAFSAYNASYGITTADYPASNPDRPQGALVIARASDIKRYTGAAAVLHSV